MSRRALLFLLAVGVSACLNDYDQFDFLPPSGSGTYETPRPDTGTPDTGTPSGDAANDAGSVAPDVLDTGSSVADAPEDDGAPIVASDALDAGDAGSDATQPADAQSDAAPGSDAGPDAEDAGPDGDLDGGVDDASPDSVVADAGELDVSVGSDAGPGDAPSPEDASVDNDVSVGNDAEPASDGSGDGEVDCGSGRKKCGNQCVELGDPATGCGGTSCRPCDLPHAAARCGAEGQCAVGSCAAGFDDCDKVPDNGCEASLVNDVNHCGTCGRPCSDLHTLSRECAQGLCVSTCARGFANCDQPAIGVDNGCERAVSAEAANCGACGNDCRAQGSGLVCGVVPDRCGCEDNANCRTAGSSGSCEKATGLCKCGASLCREGETCTAQQGPDICSCNGGSACREGQTCCQTPDGCFDLLTDPRSCGACGRACPRGLFCIQGECGCSADSHCNAGSAGTCQNGQCSCGGAVCPVGQRCLPGGVCG